MEILNKKIINKFGTHYLLGEDENGIKYWLEQPYSAASIKGTYKQRWEACEALYHTFLEGLGYTPLDWGN